MSTKYSVSKTRTFRKFALKKEKKRKFVGKC